MASKALELGGPIRIADYLSLGLLAPLVLRSLVDAALTGHGKYSQRQRDLPAYAVAYYVMALSLYRGVNTEEVLRVVTGGMEYMGAKASRREVGKSAISAARSRLGADVMQTITRHALAPLASETTSEVKHAGLSVMVVFCLMPNHADQISAIILLVLSMSAGTKAWPVCKALRSTTESSTYS